MARHLLIRLSSPLIAFGGETIDNYGVIRDFPALSMVTGLIANALGWDRGDDVLHNRLQERLRVGTRLEAQGARLTDFQTAQLGANDKAWTTWGTVEERRGGAAAYESPHLRYRDYHADLIALLALRLDPADESPTLDEVSQGLDRPQRPLFIGRKPCLPVGRLVAGWIDADSVLQALQLAPLTGGLEGLRAQWPEGEGQLPRDRLVDVCDERNWTSGVHGGWRPVREGLIKNAGKKS
ncbi:CRISPR-associated protein [Serpentinimonas maccroryi]|uniref:CRISPR-associated protein n=1 Tax=Serpentinimonas maccroryi TaxID=1458426 RepID=A0A060NY94_9BURK|nr:type I-E CRISPR-associated protein Cas5/CasD [Serpentinimonas maccroryi]MCM2479913.1 type I-E CRISPR-associated protein Cas5/CasD [Serpentinimonas maccroryi]BAO83824.1 CRISPR-associated protein [Serpentinimonas maccroryi]